MRQATCKIEEEINNHGNKSTTKTIKTTEGIKCDDEKEGLELLSSNVRHLKFENSQLE